VPARCPPCLPVCVCPLPLQCPCPSLLPSALRGSPPPQRTTAKRRTTEQRGTGEKGAAAIIALNLFGERIRNHAEAATGVGGSCLCSRERIRGHVFIKNVKSDEMQFLLSDSAVCFVVLSFLREKWPSNFSWSVEAAERRRAGLSPQPGGRCAVLSSLSSRLCVSLPEDDLVEWRRPQDERKGQAEDGNDVSSNSRWNFAND